MKKILYLLLCLTFPLASCIDEDEFPDTPHGNFEALWKIMDEHYCFFDYKKQTLGVDWNEVYARYSRQFDDGMTEHQQFEVLSNMLSELRDGHVNLYSSFDMARNWSWHEDYPKNFSDTLQRHYLGTDYLIATGLRYKILDDNIGYIYCGSFANDFGSGNLDDILSYMLTCNALIIDVRNNGGGMITSAEKLAARFTNKEILVGYMQHKKGKGHNDFSKMEEQRLKPSTAMAQEGVCADQPLGVQRSQRVRQIHEMLSQRHRRRRPHGWRRRHAVLQRTARRLERALLRLSDVRRQQTDHGIWNRSRLQGGPSARRLA